METLAEVVRSGLVESRHRGVAVRVDSDGEVVWSLGDPATVIFPRSANKPIQALAMLRAGLPLDGRLLALASASHSGEPFHLEAVREILALAELDESALQTPPSYPLDPHVHADHLRAGGGREPICMDCSGKHAAMLLTCVVNGWDTGTYLEVDHPLQQAVTATFTDLTDGPPAAVGTDGCGAPLLATPLQQLARAIGRIVREPAGSPGARLVGAMREHPEYVSGTGRTERDLMLAFPGLVAKSGAESVYVVGLPDGSAFALKIEDGAERPLHAVMARMLELAGLDAPILHERPSVLGGGKQVGEVRTTF
ncbi:asparaginase [Aeromicrobium fastidiosum]|uniref:asparaginase n=1 Tax=Aeromicrobium fastidiosum TaxID=52699 RepID=UPI001DDE7880|nr:asparaginase [Aeromicrobium fastidiosum]MBP2389323.1 L-asparaginase II [Aeromicrobium fastidiosum]